MTEAEAPTTRRAQLVNAAALLFRHRGYHAVGIDDIGAAVDLSGPAVYRYFEGKQAVLCEVISSYVEAVLAEREKRNARDPGAEHVMDAGVAAGMRMPERLITFHRDINFLDEGSRSHVETLMKPLRAASDAVFANHGVDRTSAIGSLRLQALYGVQLHLSLTSIGSKRLRADMCDRLALAGLDTPLPALGSFVAPICIEPIQHVTTREALLAAATALFHEQGFSRVSLRDVGSAVGLSASAVSRHFDSKDRLMAMIFDRAFAQISASIAAALRNSSTGEDAAREILRRYVDFAIDFRDVISIISTQRWSLAEPQQAEAVRNRRICVSELAHTVQLTRPDLSRFECRLRAGAAYAAVNEVAMHASQPRQEGVSAALTTLSQAILLA